MEHNNDRIVMYLHGGSGNHGNPITGVVLAIIPLIAAGAAVAVFSKKRR